MIDVIALLSVVRPSRSSSTNRHGHGVASILNRPVEAASDAVDARPSFADLKSAAPCRPSQRRHHLRVTVTFVRSPASPTVSHRHNLTGEPCQLASTSRPTRPTQPVAEREPNVHICPRHRNPSACIEPFVHPDRRHSGSRCEDVACEPRCHGTRLATRIGTSQPPRLVDATATRRCTRPYLIGRGGNPGDRGRLSPGHLCAAGTS
jgi:hypothetical protein